MQLDINNLNANPDLQTREIVYDTLVVADYAEAMRDGAVFPPVTVFFDGTIYWLADGFHRWAAAQQAGFPTLEADVRKGSKRDAILFAVGANADNGLRRTNGDKRKAVEKLLNDKEWLKWNDSAIARQCRVSHTFVAKLRPAHLETFQDAPRTVTRNGSTYTMNTSNIGKPAERPVSPKPIETYVSPVRVELPSWAQDEDNEPLPAEPTVTTDGCGSCRFYKPDSRNDQFFCLALEEIHKFDGANMPCQGKKYVEFQLGICEYCGQKLP